MSRILNQPESPLTLAMNPKDEVSQEKPAPEKEKAVSLPVAVMLMICAAFLYTLSNVFVRFSSDYSRDMAWDSWIIFHRSLPVFLLCWMWVGYKYAIGQKLNIPVNQWIMTLIAGCLLQIGGDINFQLSLTNAGLATAIPVNMCSVLIMGAFFSRFWLKEPLTLQTLGAQGILMIAISFIGFSRGGLPADDNVSVVRGIFHGLASGMCYGSGGVMLRYLSPRQPIFFTIFLVTLLGTPIFGIYGGVSMGWEKIFDIPAKYWLLLWLSGLGNCTGFYLALTATRRLPVVILNSISSSQIMLSSLAGIFIFYEPFSTGIMTGIALTIVGLMLMSRSKQPSPVNGTHPSKEKSENETTPLSVVSVNEQAKSLSAGKDFSIPA